MALAPDVPPLTRTSIRAGRRDTVATIAQRYRLSPGQVAGWNHVSAASSFRPGQAVVVFLSPKAFTRSTVRETSGPPSTRAVVRQITLAKPPPVPSVLPAPRAVAPASGSPVKSAAAARPASNRTQAAAPGKPISHSLRTSSSSSPPARPAVRLAKTEAGSGSNPAPHTR